ncbi:MAG: putative DNA binding domain-containing protein [Candidatus Marinimicrobia bacterium]|nr:putative DNA binding domain-containing protein [bacterium]MCG2715397.1 putative DNA binding domain-containing protein [Candidatus Neomarinimicrobiota bacterium]
MNETIDQIISQNEGKTLEFKENTSPTRNILKTAVAFANTAGGKIVFGITSSSHDIVGINNVESEEERIANILSDSISPQLIPDIQVISWRNTDLIILEIHHDPKPYYINSEGPENGVYIRHGSTNRQALPEIIKEIQLLAHNTSFDEQPCLAANSEDIDFRVASELFKKAKKTLNEHKLRSLSLQTSYQGTERPSNGYVLLFGKNRTDFFPDAIVRCARFKGKTRTTILDQTEVDTNLPNAIDLVIAFIERNTKERMEIGRTTHEKIPEYPPEVIREAVINAIVHADYAIQSSTIQIAIYDDRIEINNPGELPFGLTLEDAIAGISRLRNRVIGRVFRSKGFLLKKLTKM